MNSQDLDQLIDAAAEQLVGREPSSALTGAVMARVRATQGSGFGVPDSWFRFSGYRVWASSVAAIAIIAVIFALKSPPVAIQEPEPSASRSAVRDQPFIAAADGPPVAVPITSRQAPKHLPDRSSRSIVDEGALATYLVDDPISMEPIEAVPIDADPIDIAPIAVAASEPPPPIHIEPLIIEIISSSND
jgi:hypothetical protein